MGDSKSVRNNGVDFSPNKLQVLPTWMNFTPNIFQIVCTFLSKCMEFNLTMCYKYLPSIYNIK